MKSNTVVKYLMLFFITVTLVACKDPLYRECTPATYQKDLIDLENDKYVFSKDEAVPLLKKYLSNKDNLHKATGRQYKELLDEVLWREADRKETELSMVVFRSLKFGDSKETVLSKLKSDPWFEKDKKGNPVVNFQGSYRAYFSGIPIWMSLWFKKDKNDSTTEVLEMASLSMDLNKASDDDYYYVGATKQLWDAFVNYFTGIYGSTSHSYPDRSEFYSGHGKSLVTCDWCIRNTVIKIDISQSDIYDDYRNRYSAGVLIHQSQ